MAKKKQCNEMKGKEGVVTRSQTRKRKCESGSAPEVTVHLSTKKRKQRSTKDVEEPEKQRNKKVERQRQAAPTYEAITLKRGAHWQLLSNKDAEIAEIEGSKEENREFLAYSR